MKGKELVVKARDQFLQKVEFIQWMSVFPIDNILLNQIFKDRTASK